jgi:transposase InsO family protein
MAESFFATLKTELVYRRVLATVRHTRRCLVDWFDRYNRTRRHSHCGLRPPITYERENAANHTPKAA